VPKPRSKATVTPLAIPVDRRKLFVCLALLLVTIAVYSSVFGFDFVNFDDPDYVTANRHVRSGITAEGVKWALTSTEIANWFPITRLSHMLDCQLFGLEPGAYHAVNLLIHALAAILFFAFLHRATKAIWPSAFAAFLFAVHPLHAESVAWISERKDVLSAFFWFLALWLYVRYTEHPGTGRFVAVIVAFTLGLMSKPMLVTFPFVLVLLDHWPLRRGWRIQEKLPLFVLSFAAALSTFLAQRGSGAVQAIGELPLGTRIENALVSYVAYLAKTIWPANLAVFYPYTDLQLWQAAAALLAIAALSYLVWRQRVSRPYLMVGWLWFLGTLVPVIGLVQVGAQARADRYMYIPMAGFGIMIAWAAAGLDRSRRAIAVTAVIACIALCGTTWAQVQTWRDSETLFRHAIASTGPNYLAEHNLGVALMNEPGKLPEAITHLQSAVRLQPNSARALTDLGSALARAPGRFPEAIANYQAALKLEPDSAIPHNNLGSALSKIPGRLPDAIAELQTALRLNPGDPQTLTNLGSALLKSGRVTEAIGQLQTALRADPSNAEAHNNLGSALAESPGRLPEAIAEYEAAIRINPDYAEARNNLGTALSGMPGRLPDAIAQYEAALRIQPDNAEAHANLGTALSTFPSRLPEAISHFETAARLAPDNPEVQYNLGVALARIEGRQAEAISHLEAAIRLKPDYAEAHNNLGVVLSGIPGRLPEAIAHWHAALRIRPDYEDARANLAMSRR
jgi:tetratricopeptide (TPR) repeat protein